MACLPPPAPVPAEKNQDNQAAARPLALPPPPPARAEVRYPTCAYWSDTGLWLHLLPAKPTGKTACGRFDEDWRPDSAVPVTADEVERCEVHIPMSSIYDHPTAMICGHCRHVFRRRPDHILVAEAGA